MSRSHAATERPRQAPPNDIIDAIPADLPSDTAGMQKVVNIHITLCEQCQTLHYDPCLKYLFASTYPTTSRLEAQAAAENNDGTSSKDDAILQQIYQAAATINPIARLEPERFANGMAVTTSMGDPLDRDGKAVDRNRRRPGEFTCFTLISEDAINSSFARAISSAAPWLTNLT